MAHPRHDAVRIRAAGACEYCHVPDGLYFGLFVTEHVIARQHGRPDTADNLAYSCDRCNLFKGPNIAGLDPANGLLTRLFHPRTDHWDEHFQWSAHILEGRTPIGRTTVRVLAINNPAALIMRASTLIDGVYPPICPPE